MLVRAIHEGLEGSRALSGAHSTAKTSAVQLGRRGGGAREERLPQPARTSAHSRAGAASSLGPLSMAREGPGGKTPRRAAATRRAVPSPVQLVDGATCHGHAGGRDGGEVGAKPPPPATARGRGRMLITSPRIPATRSVGVARVQ